MVPLWKRQKSKITDEEYNQFYKDHFYDYQDPQKVIHFSVEGNTSFTALLYIPSHLPQGFYSQDYKKVFNYIVEAYSLWIMPKNCCQIHCVL